MIIKHNLCALWAVVSMTGSVMAAKEAPQLTIGNKAPAIHVDQWYKGKPFSTFEPGKFHVVEFWATWCAPCKKAIPHLTELAVTYKDKVSFTGICVFEEGKNIPVRIRKFVKDMGNKMDYTVAGDAKGGQMSKTWLTAAGENGIPCTFVIDGTGRIAWIGNPFDLEEPLKQLIAGTYDMEAAAMKRSAIKKDIELSKEFDKSIAEALKSKDFDKAFSRFREAVTGNYPEKSRLVAEVTTSLFQLDESRAYENFKALLETNGTTSIRSGLTVLLGKEGLPSRDYELVINEVQKEIKAQPKNAFLWHTLASGYFCIGDIDKARECEEKALLLLKDDPGATPADPEIFQKALAQYKKG